MEAPPAKLIGDDSSRRKDKDKGKKKKGKAKDEGKMKMDKKKTKKKKKKDKANKSLPAASPLTTSHPPLMRGSSSEGEHADERTERSISLPESVSEGAENGEEEEIMGDNTGDEVDLSFDESSENADDDAGDGSGLYHSWNFLNPSLSGSGRIITRSPSSQMLNSRPRSLTQELSEERKREVEARALAISNAMGEERIIACQALWRRALCVSRFRILVRMNRKRASIVDELIASEKDYVADLTLAVDMYLKPLRDSLSTNEPILPSEMTLRSLFSDIEVIRNYNSALLQQILRRHAQWGPYQKIGDVFVRMNHFLKAYSNYCKHYKEALITLGQLYRNNRFVAFLRKVAEGPAINGRTLEHFLALPVGRIPAYTDLLDRFARYTWETHPDRPDLSEACDSLRELTAYVQDSRADVQHILTVLHIQNTLLGTDKNIVTLGRRLVREGEIEEVSRDGSRNSMWHLFLFNDILLWTRPVVPSSSSSSSSWSSSSLSSSSPASSASCSSLPSAARNPQGAASLASSSSGGRSPTTSPRRGSRPSISSIFGSSEIPLSRSASAVVAAVSSGSSSLTSETRYNVEMIDDLVHLTVSEVPLAYNHPDAEDDYGMYMVRGTTGATPVLLVAHSARERKSWLQDLYSCIDDTVSKHYLRIGKPKRSSQPVEERKQVVHRELLGIMQLRKDEYFQYLRHSRSSAVPSNLNKKGKEKKKKPAGSKRAGLGRILPMGRRLSDATVAAETTPTRTTQNPLAQVPLRQSINPAPNMDQLAASAAPSPSLAGGVGLGGGGMGGVGLAGVDSSHQAKLHKSASVTQLDLLMAEMKNDPRAMIHLAPRLERTMQRLNLHDAWDDDRLRKKERERELREREKEREREKNNRNGSSSSSKSGFKRSLSLKMRGEKKYEKDRISGVDKEHRKDKEKDGKTKSGKGKEKEKEKGREHNHHGHGHGHNHCEEEGEAEEGEDGSSPSTSSSISAIASNNSSAEWDLGSNVKRPTAASSSSSSSGSGSKPRKSSREADRKP